MSYLASFDEFMSGNGIWIVIGVLIAALVVTTIFLVLNIVSAKKQSNKVKTEENNAENKEENNKNLKETNNSASENTNKDKQKENKEEKIKSEPKETNQETNEEKISNETKENKVQKNIYGITYDKTKREWVVKKTGSARASKRFKTKAEALEYAEKLSENNGASLRVHKKDGKFQKR